MPYFTSWDVNAFLCLIYWGLPDDVVKRMMKETKKVHEEFSFREARNYWNTNSPRMLQRTGRYEGAGRPPGYMFQINGNLSFQQTRINVFNRRKNITVEFKTQWRLRSIEERKAKVIQWCKFGNEQEQLRHQDRLSNCWIRDGFGNKLEKNPELKEERRNYTKNLWKSWEAGASSYYFVGWDRRVNISKWYEGIHPGRFFLFYKENKIIEERNRGVPRGPCEDGYQYPKTPIFDWGPYEQLIEDLRCIDGPGLGESGSKIEHIDDLFS